MIITINEFKKYLNTKVINEGSGNAKIRYNGQFWPTYYIEYYDSTDEDGDEIPDANDMFMDDFIGNVEHFKSVKLTRVPDEWISNNQVIKFESDTFKVVVVDNEWALGVGVIPAFYDENDEGEDVIPNGFNEDATKFFNELNSIYKLHTSTSAWTSRVIDNDEKITVNENVAKHINNLIKKLTIDESVINEQFNLPDGMVKALDDIDERRPNRMKRPELSDNPWAGRGGQRGLVYIQDEAKSIMQDKYGRERGTKLWQASINASQRGAMFKMADDVMKEKTWLMDQMNVQPSSYWDVSYYSLWKAWMAKEGIPYRIDSDEEVQAKADAKRAAEEAAKQQALDAKKAAEKAQFDRTLNQIESENTTAGLPSLQPDAKDKQRVIDMFRRDSWPTTAANSMAKAIKDVNKAVRRGQAVLDYVKDNNLSYYKLDIAKIFFNKAKSLLRSNENMNATTDSLWSNLDDVYADIIALYTLMDEGYLDSNGNIAEGLSFVEINDAIDNELDNGMDHFTSDEEVIQYVQSIKNNIKSLANNL